MKWTRVLSFTDRTYWPTEKRKKRKKKVKKIYLTENGIELN